jgi:iron complex transport system ATP-binding protein
LHAASGRLTAVAGPNGSGKSTIVRALLGRVPLTGGRILVEDRPLASWSAKELAYRLAVVVQREEPAFPMSVSDYVTLGRHPFRRPWSALSADDRDAINASLAQAGVDVLRSRSTERLVRR